MATIASADRVRETTTTTGTGTLDLSGAVTKYKSFVDGVGTGAVVTYCIIHRDANEWEVGYGTVTDASPDTLSRTSVSGSSNFDSLVNFSAGTKDVFITHSASYVATKNTDGTLTATGFIGNLTGNADTVTTNANLTGHITSVGNAAVLGSFTIAQLNTAISNATLSGNNTGDQTITLTGNVTGSGTGSFATTIANSAVTLAKMANVSTGTVFYRKTAGTGIPEVQTLATLKADLGLTGTNSGDQTITLTGGVTGSGTGSFTATVVTNANLTGPITSVGNATSIASQTGTGSTFVMNTSPVLISPTLGTPASGTLVNCAGLSIVGGTTGTLSVARGGTGSTSLTAGAIPYSNSGTSYSESPIKTNGTKVVIGSLDYYFNRIVSTNASTTNMTNPILFLSGETSPSTNNIYGLGFHSNPTDLSSMPAVMCGYRITTTSGDGKGDFFIATRDSTIVGDQPAVRLSIAPNGVATFSQQVSGTSLSLSSNASVNSLTITGNQSSIAWTTNGIRLIGTAGTLTDTTSSGTVATAYTNKLGGNTIAASSTVTFTNYISSYFNSPVAGSNVTFTDKWGLGADSLFVNAGSNLEAVKIEGSSSLRVYVNSTDSNGFPNLRIGNATRTWGLYCEGSAGFFSIRDVGTGNQVVRVYSTAPGGSLVVHSAGNVGLGGTPNANAALDVSSTTRAFMPPRMTTTQKNAIASPTAGMVVYDSTLNKLSVRTASTWETVTSA